MFIHTFICTYIHVELCALELLVVELHNVELHIVELHNVELHIVELHNVKLHIVELHNVELHNVELHNVEIHHVELHHVELHNVELHNVQLNNVELRAVLFWYEDFLVCCKKGSAEEFMISRQKKTDCFSRDRVMLSCPHFFGRPETKQDRKANSEFFPRHLVQNWHWVLGECILFKNDQNIESNDSMTARFFKKR
jgi:hypothetical protein